MAHKGKQFPIKQEWRLYDGDGGSLAAYPPSQIEFRTQFWHSTYTPPPVNTWIICDPLPWDPGDYEIAYQSVPISSGGHSTQVGARGRIQDDGTMLWKYCVWDNTTDQIPWGWHDTFNHFAWSPGDLRNIFTDPPAGGSIYPVGQVEIRAKLW